MKDEPGEIKIGARVHLGQEQGVAVAKEFDDKDGSGMTHLLKKLTTQPAKNNSLQKKLRRWQQLFSSFKS